MKIHRSKFPFSILFIVSLLACSFPGIPQSSPTELPTESPAVTAPSATETQVVTEPTVTPFPTLALPTATITVPHSLIPSTIVGKAKVTINDVTSVDTAAENRAPYGDSYNISLFERPFTQDMTYLPDVDIVSYSLAYDEKFFYVSIELIGTNPNNAIGIDYAVELDINADGFGDYLILGRAPHEVNWATHNVQILKDTDHDTGGLSPERSDAPLPGNGYDTVVFDGNDPDAEDTDLAWMRINAGSKATVQFAFKRTFAGENFMFGVMADAGIRNAEDYDYVDRFTEEEAGSPERGEKEYPLKALYAVDNVCRAVYGFKGTGDEPRRCLDK
ncbi:MAG: hypothetical protein IT310_10730 [Anaerolineales bacterium]|nr:hypothetical protein [Anaerolineales bacterium]